MQRYPQLDGSYQSTESQTLTSQENFAVSQTQNPDTVEFASMTCFSQDQTFYATFWELFADFEKKRYPISADIEGMYMQVSVRPDDRKFLRFLWGTDKPDFYEYTRFVFGAKCSPTCAIYALRKCADDNINTHPHIRDIVCNNFYMDDFFESTDSIEDALQLYQDLRDVLKLGGFNLTK